MSRKLGPHETYGAVRSILGSYSNVVVSATLNTPTTRQGLLYAAKTLLHKEPLLGVSVSGQEGSFKMTKLEHPKPETFVDTSLLTKQLEEVVTDIHYVRLDLSKQHWKLFLLSHGKEVVFLYDHALLDGMSGLFVIERVVKVVISPPVSLLLKELFKEYLYSRKPTSLPLQQLNWTGYHSIIDFSALQSRAFHSMCKSSGFSVGAGLYALLVCASSAVLHRKYPDAVSGPVRGLVPLNARNYTPKQNPKRLGMVVGESILSTVVPGPGEVLGEVPSRAFVKIALEFKSTIARDSQKTLFSGYPFMHPVGLIPWVHSLQEYFKKHTDNHQRSSMLAMSNLTCSDIPCEQLRFTQCTGGTSPFIQFSVVGLKGKGISVGLGVSEDEEVLNEVDGYIRWFARECEVYGKVG
ncbi:hypothetical protein CJU90_3935 [Yarrowia sp. C11]|nr:hypothetical protein CKK34_5547 [Yarrowia sp. E02]KAG5367634.1 hypothetical protein CJU90_3935 [Yarrowia sp. C11]